MSDTGKRLFFVDNGKGMDRESLIKCFSSGYTIKADGRIGQFGYGFQGGCLSNGKSVMVSTLTLPEGDRPSELNIGLLSLKMMKDMGHDDVVFPIMTWRKAEQDKEESPAWTLLKPGTKEVEDSLTVLRAYTPYPDEQALLNGALRTLRLRPGTSVELFDLDSALDLTDDDIKLKPSARTRAGNEDNVTSSEMSLDRSLRAYLQVLYLKQPMIISIQGRIVQHVSIKGSLVKVKDDKYHRKAKGQETVIPVKYAIGLASPDKFSYGVVIYRRNRLLSWQKHPSEELKKIHEKLFLGLLKNVVCVVEVDDTFQPEANKQKLKHSEELVKMQEVLRKKLQDYMVLSLAQEGDLERVRCEQEKQRRDESENLSREMEWRKALELDPRAYLQCCECDKLRFVTEEEFAKFSDGDQEWVCGMNHNKSYQLCNVPQEEPQAKALDSQKSKKVLVDVPFEVAEDIRKLGGRIEKIEKHVTVREDGSRREDKYFWVEGNPSRMRSLQEVKRYLMKQDAPTGSKKRGIGTTDKEPPKKKAKGAAASRVETKLEANVAMKKLAAKNAKLEEELRKEKHEKQRLEDQKKTSEKKAKKLELDNRHKARELASMMGQRRSGRLEEKGTVPNDHRICLCRLLSDQVELDTMYQCSGCKEYFHASCLKLSQEELDVMDLQCVDHGELAVNSRAEILKTKQRIGLIDPRPDPYPAPSMQTAVPPHHSTTQRQNGAIEAASSAHAQESSLLKVWPDNWPRSVQFISSRSVYSNPSSEEARLQMRQQEASPHPGLMIKMLSEVPDHPLGKSPGEFGLFASKKLDVGSFVLPYLGWARPQTAHDGQNGFAMSLPSGNSAWQLMKDGQPHDQHVVDAALCGNEARFINDYRGIKPSPNVEFFPTKHHGELVVGVFTLRPIKAGEELLAFYGPEYPIKRLRKGR